MLTSSSLCLLIVNHRECFLSCFIIFDCELTSVEFVFSWLSHVAWVMEVSFQSCFTFFFCQILHGYPWLNFYVKFLALGFLYHVTIVNLDSKPLHGKAWDFDFSCKTFFCPLIRILGRDKLPRWSLIQWVGFF